MPIHFAVNDPRAKNGPPLAQKTPRKRAASRAGFTLQGAKPSGLYQPGTPEFLFWQCREAALWALAVWEGLDGPLSNWSSGVATPKRLLLNQNAGIDLNAYYDRESLSFFERTTGTKTTFSGASTDVVAHEAGHALLDTIRPELWDSTFTETAAFHEAFGDCIAILVALSDPATRTTLLAASPTLGNANFVEATAEDLSDGIRRAHGASHSAAAPRHAFNSFRWQIPATLPEDGSPTTLTSEIHSFGRIMSGCFYDTIRFIFAASGATDSAALARAAKTAGRLLIAATKSAPETPRFFQAVGRAMILADEATHGGSHHAAIRDAFTRHGIALGSAAMLAPKSMLAGKAPAMAAVMPQLAAATRQDLRRRLGLATTTALAVSEILLGKTSVFKAVHNREVPLGDLGAALKGVVAFAAEPVLVGSSGARAALLSSLPETHATTEEVHTFVAGLLRHAQIATGKKGAVATRELPTHVVRSLKGKKVLMRRRFACCGR